MKLAACHPARKEQARGLCKNCYDKWLKGVNPAYRKRQMSNSTKWARANPEKIKKIRQRRRRKELSDPAYKTKRRERDIFKKYGITQEDYKTMLKSQKNGCAICARQPNKGKHLHIDHCHFTKFVRGLLCHQCNWYLGTIDADPKILKKIEQYRTQYKNPNWRVK